MAPLNIIPLILVLVLAIAGARADDGPVAAPQLRVGASWTYEVRNGFNGMVVARYRYRVASASPDRTVVEVMRGDEALAPHVLGPGGTLAAWTSFSGRQESFSPPLRVLPFPLAPGVSWYEVVTATDALPDWPRRVQVWGEVLGWETVKVPAGEFRALKIRRASSLGEQFVSRGQTQMAEYDWYAPEIGLVVKHREQGNFYVRGPDVYWQEVDRFVAELVEYAPAR